MEIANVVGSIDAPIKIVWALFSDFGGVKRLYPLEGVPPLPPISKVEIAGDGIGAIRTVHTLRGDPARERLTRCDTDTFIIEYEALSLPIGIESFTARIQLREEPAGRTVVTYTAEGIPTTTSPSEAREILTLLYTALIDGARRVGESQPISLASAGN